MVHRALITSNTDGGLYAYHTNALADSGSTGIEVPSTIFPKIQALIGATFDTTNGFTVPCTVLGTGKLPTLQLRIGGHIYTLTEKNYIQQVRYGVPFAPKLS